VRNTLLLVATLAVGPFCSFGLSPRSSGGISPEVTFAGSGQESIQAMAADAHGNIYVAGTTSSPDFPVKNAEQPQFGDSRMMRSVDRGANQCLLGTGCLQPAP
jgi:hypothetical protein